MEHVLAVDLGTSGPKAALIGADGTVTACRSGTVRLLLGPGGAAEQDPDEWWQSITAAVRSVVAAAGDAARRLVAVAVTAQWSGTVAVGADGRHLMNAIIWMDSRGARYIGEVTGGPVRLAGYDVRKLRLFLSRAGGLPGHSGKDPTAHIRWIRAQRPRVYDATTVFLEPADYLNLRLTGRACTSADCIALHWVADIRDLSNVHYDDHLLRISGLDAGQLPELVPSASVVGELLPAVAAQWGIRAGIPVTTATGDMASAVVGSGAIADFAGHLYIGTSSWLSCHVPWKRTDIVRNQTTLPSAIPGRYFIANEHETAGACLTFARDCVLAQSGTDREHGPRPEAGTAALDGTGGYRELDDAAAVVRAGAGRIIFTPWLNGERTPVDDHTVRGGFHNLSLTATRADLVRAVFEGVAYNSRWLLESVERFARHDLPELAFIGGGARSALWCQIHADVMHRAIRCVRDPAQANVRGAALLALLALRLAGPDELAQRVPVAAHYQPDPGNRAIYDELYGAFKTIYKRNRRLYAQLNRC